MMRFWLRRDRAIAFCLLFLPVMAQAQDKNEPNNAVGEATVLKVGKEFAFTIDPQHDVDVFKIVPPEDGVLSLNVLETPEVHQPYPYWLNAEGAVLWEGSYYGLAKKGEAVYLAFRSHYYNHDAQASPEEIRIRVDMITGAFDAEPNQSVETALPLVTGEEKVFMLVPQHDVDVFKIVPPKDGVLTLTVLETPEVHQPYPYWLNAEGEVVRDGMADASATGGEAIYLAFRSHYYGRDAQASPDAIRIRVDYLDARDDYEPNDSIETAKMLPVESEVTITLTPRGDLDIFKLESDEDVLYRYRLVAAAEGLQPYLVWLDEKGEVIRTGAPELWVPGGRTVYLQIQSAWRFSDMRSWMEPMKFRVSAIFTTDRFEPNDTAEAAAPLAVGRRVQAEWLAGEQDLFLVGMDEAGTYRAEVSPSGGVNLTWIDGGGNAISEDLEMAVEGPSSQLLRVTGIEGAVAAVDYELIVVNVGGDPAKEPGLYPRTPPELKLAEPLGKAGE